MYGMRKNSLYPIILSDEMSAQDNFDTCVKKLKISFNYYDQCVDVVSCWHSLFDHYIRNGAGKYFDRYPSLENDQTPDFTMCFNDEYGWIVDVTHSINDSNGCLEDKIQQIQNYDKIIKIKNGPGKNEYINVGTKDIILLVNQKYSNESAISLRKYYQENPSAAPENNLILLEYTLENADAYSAYIFKKMIHAQNGIFRDESLPQNYRLEPPMGEKGKPLPCTPEKFVVNKSTHLFCNDAPCPIYLAARMWDRIFINILTPAQLALWKKSRSTIVNQIIVTPSQLKQIICEKISPGCNIEEQIIINALEFLKVAKRAEKKGAEWEIPYRNLVQKKLSDPSGNTFEEMRAYADILAKEYCNETDHSLTNQKKVTTGKQQSLSNF